MIYKKFQDLELSALGLGTMRLPLIDNDKSKIDEEASAEMLRYAMENGINYYDTAWAYHEGNSEIVMGKLLKEYPRESFYLASKFPGYDPAYIGKVEEIFEKQLERCQVEYFDFYLFHNVCEKNIDLYLDEKYGVLEYLLKQKENGRIKHLGFSTHGSYDNMKQFIDAYGEHMEFCQIQLNWLDWSLQDAKRKVDLLNEYNLPIWVMEPLRGGKLASLSEEHTKKLVEARADENVPAWAFRFLQTIPNVVMTLSGMSNMEQLSENINTYKEERPLSQEEWDLLLSIADDMTKEHVLPCTGCSYCTKNCPMGLDIPKLIEVYNDYNYSDGGFYAPMLISTMPEDKRPSACVGCRGCETVCPQEIKISEVMSDFAAKLEKEDE